MRKNLSPAKDAATRLDVGRRVLRKRENEQLSMLRQGALNLRPTKDYWESSHQSLVTWTMNKLY